MTKWTLLLLGLLGLLACQTPETAPPPPPAVARKSPEAPKEVLIQVEAGRDAEAPESVLADLRPELLEAFKDWGARPFEGSANSTTPVLRVQVKRYKGEPAGSPFAYIGLPGIGGLTAGVSMATAAAASDVFPVTLILGAGLAATGLAALIVGGVLGGHQASLDRQRGYPLHSLRAEARLELRLGTEQRALWEESYRTLSLRNAARPLSPEEAREPARVRRETLRALARCIKEDAGNAVLKAK